jgi:hypothetical protein
MSSTLRNDTRRALALARIATAGDKRPDLSLGELIASSLDVTKLARMGDTEIAEAVERFVLLGQTDPPGG